MGAEPEIHGSCDPRFAAVRSAFRDNFAAQGEIGAAACVTLHGEPVVDLWGGHKDQNATQPWERDTLVNVYSTTKGMTAICAARLVESGDLDLSAPVADYWPEFAQAGKGDLPVRWLLNHRAGLPAVRETLPPQALYDWDAMVGAVAAEAPWWKPGTIHGYHALTYGWLLGELVRRISGRSTGRYFREEIAQPLGADFHIGLPESEHGRVAEMGEIPIAAARRGEPSLSDLLLSDPDGLAARAFSNPPSMADGPNIPAWRSAEIPAANGHGTARAVAVIYGALASGKSRAGVQVLAPETIEAVSREESVGPDQVLGISTRFGLGFMLSQDRLGAAFGPGARSFGHPGAGGSVGFADPDTGIGFGYVMNRMGPHILLDPRPEKLIEAVYGSMG